MAITNKGKKFPPEPLSPTEAASLIKACGRGKTGHRNRALVAILWRSGLRVSEALALRPSDCDRGRGTILVRCGKGGKSRTVGADAGTFDLIDRWLAVRPVEGATLLCTLQGGPVAPVYVRNLMRRLGERAGIQKRVHPHGLRHTHACELRKEGVDIGVISKQLGHSSIATTHTYLNHVDATAVRDSIAGREGWAA